MLRGEKFDRRYAENELSYHEFVNAAVRDQFIPALESDEFREALKGALAVFEGHVILNETESLELGPWFRTPASLRPSRSRRNWTTCSGDISSKCSSKPEGRPSGSASSAPP